MKLMVHEIESANPCSWQGEHHNNLRLVSQLKTCYKQITTLYLEMEFPLTFGEFGDKLKSGEERIVKLEWKENGKVYKEDLVIKK